MSSQRATPRTEPALRLIIGYKFARAGAALLASGLLAAFTATGHTGVLHEIAKQLRHHVTSAWSIGLADALIRAIVPRHLWMLAAAFAFDGAFTVVEGLSLHRRWAWGPWLVVVATAVFVPFEVSAILRRVSIGRVLLLTANLMVALYLARHALRARRSSQPDPAI